MSAVALLPSAEPSRASELQDARPAGTLTAGGGPAPSPPDEIAALRQARSVYAAWLQRCLRQGAYRSHPGAVPALPHAAISAQLDRALQHAGADVAELAALGQRQRARLVAIRELTVTRVAADKRHPRAAQDWNRLIDLGLDVLQGFAEMEIVCAARRAAHDALTGLPGRALLLQRLQSEQARVARHGDDCAVVMVDLDHFKQINDRHGHHTGDRVLVAFARLLRSELRPYDGVYRYGGEEFVLVLPGASVEQAVRIVERIRAKHAARALVHTQGGVLRLRFSAGVAALTTRPIALTLRCADQALYAAKANGRDQVQRERGNCACT